LNWVGDLALECTIEASGGGGEVVLDLVKAGKHHRCAIDLASGQARLSIDALPEFRPQATTAVRGGGTYALRLANVDQELLLWVDNELVEFDQPTTYRPTWTDEPRVISTSDRGDLAPAGVGVRGAAVGVSGLRLWRDVYYIAESAHDPQGRGQLIMENPALPQDSREELARFLSDPKRWGSRSSSGQRIFDGRAEQVFRLHDDQFFALGDNSPASKDSRLWPDGPMVDRQLLIGKAMFIYWPHAWPAPYNVPLRLLGTEVRLPFYPNFRRMQLIH
jgi:signal peptidase I